MTTMRKWMAVLTALCCMSGTAGMLANAETEIDGTTITAMIAHRDCLTKKTGILRNFLAAASSLTQRASRTEIVIRSTVSVADLQKQVDELSKEIRVTDTKIQAANWTTELI